MQNDENFYAAPSAPIHDPHGYGGYGGEQVLLASRGSRLIASILDGLPVIVILMLLALPAFFAYKARAEGQIPDPSGSIWMILTALFSIAWAGTNLYWLHQSGQTIGKKIMKIKIVRSDLQTRASLLRIIFLRFLPVSVIGYVPILGSLIQLANYLFIFGAEQRCLHDWIADTHVIQITPATASAPGYTAQPPMASW